MALAVLVRHENVLLQGAFAFLVASVASLTFSIAVSSVTFAVALLLWLAVLGFSNQKVPPTPLDSFFLAYVAAEVLTTLFSVDMAASFFNMKRLLLVAVVYLTASSLTSRQRFVWAVGILVGVAALLSLIESLMLSRIGGHFFRLGMFQHYMTAGGMKMIVLLLTLPFIIGSAVPTKWRVLSLAAFVPTFIALMLTQTRSSWLGFLAGAILLGIVRNRKFLVALVVFIVLFFLFGPADFQTRAFSIIDLTHKSNVTRINMITTGWRMFLDYPIFGTGDIDLKHLYVTYTEPIDLAEGGHLHNNFMMLLVTLGAVGCAAVMAMFVKIVLVELDIAGRTKSHWLYGSVAAGCLAAYVGFHVNGLFEWNFGDHEIAVLLWFTVGLTLVSGKLQSSDPVDS